MGAALATILLVGCSPPTSDGGEIVVTDDERVEEVRAAREALATPVPAVGAEAERLADAVEQLWTEEGPADERGERAAALRAAPFRDALAALDAVSLEGIGPDVEAARAILDAMVADGEALLEAVEAEVATLTALPAFDAQLDELLAGWDARGSYSQQLEAFEQLVADAEALAADAAARTAAPACTEAWPRRESAALVVAERSEELRDLVRDRRGQEFDDLRDEYGQDPFGVGEFLGVLDAEAAAACWADGSDVPAARVAIEEGTAQLATVLDPPDLRG